MNTLMSRNLCHLCNRRFFDCSHIIYCRSCSGAYHRCCTGLTRSDFDSFSLHDGWICKQCIGVALPFNHIEDDCEFLNAVYNNSLDNFDPLVGRFQNRLFDPYELNENESFLPFGDIDPDTMYFNEIVQRININSNYYMEHSFNKYVSKNKLEENSIPMQHLNIRSIPHNFSKYKAYKSNLKLHFPILGFTETNLTKSNTSYYELEDYKHMSLPKSTLLGHGVSIYVDKCYDSDEYPNLTRLKPHIECIFAKITIGSTRIIVGVVYRPPSSNIDDFISEFTELTDLLKRSNKPCYIMGDCNVDLMKYDSHKKTSEFLDLIFANSFIPLINRPTRITSETATLIDHIYTNNYNINDKLYQGILLTDISDHNIVFHVWKKDDINANHVNDTITIRQVNENNLKKYKDNIEKWGLERAT